METSSLPSLVILEHTSLAEEKFAKNGVQKNVHVVVKNTPFHITVGFSDDFPSHLNFNNVTAEVLLMYDCEGDRFVDFIKNKPLEYKGTMSDCGDKMILEIRLKKLSSHLEDMFFKIRVKGVDSVTNKDIPGLFVTSQAIKVVSKPEQVARIKQSQTGGAKVDKKPRAKKRSINDMMLESMQNLERQAEEHRQMLQLLVSQKQTDGLQTSPTASSFSKKGVPSDLEQAMINLLSAYENTDPMERPLKIRKVLSNTTASGASSLLELASQVLYNTQKGINYQEQTLASSDPMQGANGSNSAIITDNIALSDDIERIDDFYRELLLPSSF